MKKLFALISILTILSCMKAGAADNIPKKFVFDTGGIMGFHTLVLIDGKLSYRLNHSDNKAPYETINATPEKWAEFRRAIDKIGIWNWQDKYENPGLADGLKWQIKIEYDGKSIASEGEGAFPRADGSSSPEPTQTFKDLVKAVSALIGEDWSHKISNNIGDKPQTLDFYIGGFTGNSHY